MKFFLIAFIVFFVSSCSDPRAKDKEILVNLQHEKPNMCIIICEHQARELLSIVDRALVLSNCKIIAEGSPNTLVKDKVAKEKYFGNYF